MRIQPLILVLLLCVAGCSWFETEAKPPLQGDRTDVLPHADDSANTTGATPKLGDAADVPAWPQQNASAAQTGAHAGFTPTFERIWSTAIGEVRNDRLYLTARPVGADGKIFAMDSSGNVTALNAENGEVLWRVRSRQGHKTGLAGGLAVDGGTLYVTDGLPEVLALSTQNGGLLWRAELDAPARAAPAVANGKVFAVTRGDQSFALDAASGKILWQHHGLQENAGIIASAPPAADDEMVVICYASGEVIALSPSNGSVLWGDNLASSHPDNNLATLHDLRAPPMLLPDMVVTGNFAAETIGIERRLGDRIWTQSFGTVQPMTASGDTVFVITTNQQLMALARDSGTKFWSKTLLPPKKPDEDEDPLQQYWYGPLLLNQQVFVISAGGTGQLRDAATGEVAKEIPELPAPAENPIVMNHTLYWVTANGDVVAYH